MVSMVHMNIFYRMGLEMYDSKHGFWTNDENVGRSNKMNNPFEVQNGVSECLSKTKMTFKNILESSGVIPAQFPFITI